MTWSNRIEVLVLLLSGVLMTALAPSAPAQQIVAVHGLKVGDCIQFSYAGGWESATISGPEYAGGYPANWGMIGTTVPANSRDIRPCPAGTVAPGADPETKAALARLPKGNGLGAQYGTRDPATCANRKVEITAETAKKLLACDSEGELMRDQLYLITDEVVQVGGWIWAVLYGYVWRQALPDDRRRPYAVEGADAPAGELTKTAAGIRIHTGGALQRRI